MLQPVCRTCSKAFDPLSTARPSYFLWLRKLSSGCSVSPGAKLCLCLLQWCFQVKCNYRLRLSFVYSDELPWNRLTKEFLTGKMRTLGRSGFQLMTITKK